MFYYNWPPRPHQNTNWRKAQSQFALSLSHLSPSLFDLFFFFSFLGVATIVQGAIVQGDSCPRRQLSKGQLSKELLSKEIFVQVDSCPRRLLSKADFSPRRQLHVFLSKEELCFREGFKNIQRGCARFLKVCRYNQLHSKSCYDQLCCNMILKSICFEACRSI